MNNSANKVVVITGASSGIGQAIALHLADKPFSLVLVARRLERINALVDQIIQQGGQAIAVKAAQCRAAAVSAGQKGQGRNGIAEADHVRAVAHFTKDER